jgi:hypothetical protein
MYRGLPPARSVEEAIVLAQRLIARDLEQRAKLQLQEGQADDHVPEPVRPAA